jgi:hypothetical protein
MDLEIEESSKKMEIIKDFKFMLIEGIMKKDSLAADREDFNDS